VTSILHKALLDEKNNSLSRLMEKVLRQVHQFTYKKDQFFYPSALSEFDKQQ